MAKGDGLREQVAQAVAPQERQQQVRSWLQQLGPELRRAVPRGVDAERIVRLALTEIRRTPELALCTRDSLLGAVMWSAQLGLEIGAPLGQSYIIPFRNHGLLEAQWVLGYTGQLALLYRSPRIRDVFVGTVREGDGFTYRRGIEDALVHEPKGFDEARKVVCYYLLVRYTDGGHYIATMTPEEIERRRRKAQRGAPRSGPWLDWPEEMERKTVIRAHFRFLPLEVQAARAFAADELVVRAAEDAEGGVVIPATAEVPLTHEAAEEPAAPAAPKRGRERVRAAHEAPATQGSEPTEPQGIAKGPDAQAQGADPHTALRRELGRLGLSGPDVRRLLAPMEALEVAALSPDQAAHLASVLAGMEPGEGAVDAALAALGEEEATT